MPLVSVALPRGALKANVYPVALLSACPLLLLQGCGPLLTGPGTFFDCVLRNEARIDHYEKDRPGWLKVANLATDWATELNAFAESAILLPLS